MLRMTQKEFNGYGDPIKSNDFTMELAKHFYDDLRTMEEDEIVDAFSDFLKDADICEVILEDDRIVIDYQFGYNIGELAIHPTTERTV